MDPLIDAVNRDPAIIAAKRWRIAQAAVELEQQAWSAAECQYLSASVEDQDEGSYRVAERRWLMVCEDEMHMLESALLTEPSTLQGSLAVLNVLLEADGGGMENRDTPIAVRNVRDCIALITHGLSFRSSKNANSVSVNLTSAA